MACRYVGISAGTLGAGLLMERVGLNYALLTTSAIQVVCMLVIVVAVNETVVPARSALGNKNDRKSNVVLALKASAASLQRKRNDEEKLALVPESEEEVEEASSSDSLLENLPERRPRRRVAMIVAILSLSFLTQSVYASQREVVVQSVSGPPFNWPGSWSVVNCSLCPHRR